MQGQRITFGLHLDGQRPKPAADALGVSLVGPLGLLNILEAQLGLLALRPSQAERTVQYQDCLHRLDSTQRFYHRSFAIDPLGTASSLLDWRDQWALHGWDGAMSSESPRRLRDLSEVEALASTAVAPNLGQRLKAVKAALQKRQPDIEQILLVDAIETLPYRWREVLAGLPVVAAGELAGQGRGFLGALQTQLHGAASGQDIEKLAWHEDGTVLVVQAETSILANHWLTAKIAENCPTLLVCTRDSMRLDAQLSAADQPRQGLRHFSAFRPALQVLPLALELLWEPLDFQALVQFLTHPLCPVPGYVGRRLAEKVADAPGIGGAYWERTLARIDEHYGEERAVPIRETIALWIEHARFPSEFGAPIEAVIERVAQLAAFFRRRLGEADAAKRLAFAAGYGQCQSCLQTLLQLQAQGQGTTVIRPRQLQKLVAQNTASGADNPLWPAEVGATQVVNHPGAPIEPVARVIWSPLSLPVLPSSDPWSTDELRALKEAGVDLPSAADRLEQVTASWLRPVMAAREQLVLVLPPAEEEVHPLWLMVESLVEKPRILALETLLSAGGATLAPLTAQPLPAPKRWWQLPDDVSVALRPKESFSSLEKLLFNPYHWLLQYPARLQASRIVSLDGGFRLLGNLAHRLVEQYFLRPDALTMSEMEFDAWFASTFVALIDDEGATLKAPGRGADLQGFRQCLQQALRSLREQVAKAGMLQVLPERVVYGQFPGGELAGSVDLMMENALGELAIVDMKWSGTKKYPEKLRQNRHLQLVLYAELLRQETGRWPSVAYYILDRGRFFAPDDRAFADAEAVPPVDGESTLQLWQRFLATWRWRVAQIQAGQFEVVLEGILADEAAQPPEDAMAMETLNEAYNEYRTLAGWER